MLSGPCPFFYLFFSLIIALTIFFPQFLGYKSQTLEKKLVFCLVVRGVYPLYTLSGPTTKKNFFYVCLPLVALLLSLTQVPEGAGSSSCRGLIPGSTGTSERT